MLARKQFTFYLDEELVEKIRDEADSDRISLSRRIEQILAQYVKGEISPTN